MGKVSFIGKEIAKEGLEFIFAGPLQECSGCKVKNACFSLEPGRSYRVTKLRDKKNPCNIFLGGEAVAVDVEETDQYINSIYGVSVQEGSIITTSSMKCDNYSCDNIETCNLLFMREGVKAKILSVKEKLDCPKGYDMRRLQVAYK